MPKREFVDMKLEMFMETKIEKGNADGAILVSEDGGKTKVWLPKSQIEWEPENQNPMSRFVNVTMPLWLASKSKFAGY